MARRRPSKKKARSTASHQSSPSPSSPRRSTLMDPSRMRRTATGRVEKRRRHRTSSSSTGMSLIKNILVSSTSFLANVIKWIDSFDRPTEQPQCPTVKDSNAPHKARGDVRRHSGPSAGLTGATAPTSSAPIAKASQPHSKPSSKKRKQRDEEIVQERPAKSKKLQRPMTEIAPKKSKLKNPKRKPLKNITNADVSGRDSPSEDEYTRRVGLRASSYKLGGAHNGLAPKKPETKEKEKKAPSQPLQRPSAPPPPLPRSRQSWWTSLLPGVLSREPVRASAASSTRPIKSKSRSQQEAADAVKKADEAADKTGSKPTTNGVTASTSAFAHSYSQPRLYSKGKVRASPFQKALNSNKDGKLHTKSRFSPGEIRITFSKVKNKSREEEPPAPPPKEPTAVEKPDLPRPPVVEKPPAVEKPPSIKPLANGKVPRTDLTSLDDDWNARLAAFITNKTIPASDLVVDTIERAPVYRHAFSTILPQANRPGDNSIAWLNDEIMNAYIQSCVTWANLANPRVNPKKDAPYAAVLPNQWWNNMNDKGYSSVSRWAKRKLLEGPKFLEGDLVLIPVVAHSHWTLLVVWPKLRLVRHYNSFNGANSSAYLAKAKEYLRAELKTAWKEDEWAFEKGRSPVQRNGHDCGMFVCTNAKLLTLDLEPDGCYVEAQMGLLRRRVAAELLNGGFTNEFDLRHLSIKAKARAGVRTDAALLVASS